MTGPYRTNAKPAVAQAQREPITLAIELHGVDVAMRLLIALAVKLR